MDSIISYMCEDPDFLKVGHEVNIDYYWDTPHYKDDKFIEQMDLAVGGKIKTTIRLLSSWESLEESEFWEWNWAYPSGVEVIED